LQPRERGAADGSGAAQRASSAQSAWLFAAFFVSGCPALIYQLVWQRALFTIYGVNVEAITAVVAAFMLGLGLGSIAGGALSKLAGNLQLLLFAGLELGIGAFGLGSLALFSFIGRLTLGASALETGVLAFLLVLLPTCLMGATLPLLVAHLVRRYGNVGRSLGVLYFVNPRRTLDRPSTCS
jgi:spermidine synthase